MGPDPKGGPIIGGWGGRRARIGPIIQGVLARIGPIIES